MDDNAKPVVAERDDLRATPVVGVFALVNVVLPGALDGEEGLRRLFRRRFLRSLCCCLDLGLGVVRRF